MIDGINITDMEEDDEQENSGDCVDCKMNIEHDPLEAFWYDPRPDGEDEATTLCSTCMIRALEGLIDAAEESMYGWKDTRIEIMDRLRQLRKTTP